jgi:DNA replication protein DnaC
MTQETLRKLRQLRLNAMADKIEEMSASQKLESQNPTDLLALIVDSEYDRRRQNQISRLLRDAHIKLPQACIEDIEFSAKRNITKDAFRDLADASFIQRNQNILVSGATGVGKTYIASAFANLACRNGLSTRYFRLSNLLETVILERRLGNYLKVIEKFGKLRLLIIDDIGPDVLTKEERNIFMDLIEERYLTASTILTSQLPFDQWYAVFEDPTVADAICDRLFHNAVQLKLGGDSMRKKMKSSGR